MRPSAPPYAKAALILAALGSIALGCGGGPAQRKRAVPVIEKQPVSVTTRTFDPANPPADMPPLSEGEIAQCESNFISLASVGGQGERSDATHAILTVTQAKVTLQLEITIWVPEGASQRVLDHEDGHRQIAEHYYQTADKVAERIAATYIGQHVLVTGADLQGEMSKSLQGMGKEITDEYDKEMDPEATQLRYDAITDHSRNDVAVSDAVAQALKDTGPDQPAPGN